MGNRNGYACALAPSCGEGAVGGRDLQLHGLADKFQPRIAHQNTRQKAHFGQHLKAVADPDDITATLRMGRHFATDRRVCRNGTTAQVVAIGETAGNDDQVEVFDLEAYRELLLLHAIAKELIHRDEAPGASHSEFRQTSMQPLKADGRVRGRAAMAAGGVDAAVRNTEPMALDGLATPSAHMGLDINLNDLSEFSAFEASLPETTPPVEPAVRPQTQAGEAVSNLIDFEVLDFMPPDDDPPAKPGGRG